jgi:hypothetical protein
VTVRVIRSVVVVVTLDSGPHMGKLLEGLGGMGTIDSAWFTVAARGELSDGDGGAGAPVWPAVIILVISFVTVKLF